MADNIKTTSIKINFQTEPEEDAFLGEDYVDKIINGIESGKRTVFKVYMKNLMPIREMDNAVRELCDIIHSRYNTSSKNYRSNECIAPGYVDTLSSATYYISLTHDC